MHATRDLKFHVSSREPFRALLGPWGPMCCLKKLKILDLFRETNLKKQKMKKNENLQKSKNRNVENRAFLHSKNAMQRYAML